MAGKLRTAEIASPDWTARIETDGRVRRADRELRFMFGWTDQEVRAHAANNGWKARRIMTVLERAEEDPVVQAVMGLFPGAEVVDVRPIYDGSADGVELPPEDDK